MVAGLRKAGIMEIGLGVESPGTSLSPIGHAIAADRMVGGSHEGFILLSGNFVLADRERLGEPNFHSGPFVVATTGFIRWRPDRERAGWDNNHFRTAVAITKLCASSKAGW
jgi:hypothetical protein